MGVLTMIILPVLLIVVAAQNELQPMEAGMEAGAAEPVPKDWTLTQYHYERCRYHVEFERKDLSTEKCEEQTHEEQSLSHIHNTIKALLEEEPPNNKGCPISGYVSFNGGCYKDFPEQKTYNQARQRCAEDGGQLAMPKDSATNTFISDLRNEDGFRWLGLTDVSSEGQWVFEDGKTLGSTGYSNWRPGEPNNVASAEDCVVFGTHARWNDLRCDESVGFICQIDQVTVCEHSEARTTENQYEYHWDLPRLTASRFTFEVQANHDVHVALSSQNQDLDDMYEIVIGGWGNSKSMIRRSKQGHDHAKVSTVEINSQTEYRAFWITWSSDGTIAVGRGGESQPFMQWKDPDPLSIAYAGYSTGFGSTGQWKFCPEASTPLKPHRDMAPEQLYQVLQQQQDKIREQENIIVTLQDRINSGIPEEQAPGGRYLPLT
ncbi:uncharacterized protein LOC144860153 [Branchiostoma floridae x Branchiostoma japonicum]